MEKKNKKQLLFILTCFSVFLIGVGLRLINIDKMSGLWHDEITIYSIASKHFISGMINIDLHRFFLFPLYFIFYKIWLVVFGTSDFAIRTMSVFFDSLSIICAFFIGKEFAKTIKKEKKGNAIGLVNMILYALNSSFIYYAQEAKFYAITLFFINMMIIFWLKFLRRQNFKNTFLFLFFNFLVLYTYTSQIVLLVTVQIVTLIYFLIYKKENIKNYVKQLFCFLIILVPLFIMILRVQGYFSGNFDAVAYDNSFILLLLQNFFTPILQGLQNNILNYGLVTLLHILSIKWWIFIFFPIIFYLVSIVKGCRNEKISKLFVGVFLLYFLFHTILTIFTDYGVLVRYVLPVLPFLLIVAAYGFEELLDFKRGFYAFFILVFVNLYALSTPIGANKIPRPDNYRELASVINSNKINPKNDFILPIREDLLDKYFKVEGRKLSLYVFNTEKYKETYLSKEDLKEVDAKKNVKEKMRKFLLSEKPSKNLENIIVSDFVKPVKKGENLVYIKDCGICLLNEEQIKQIVSNEKSYQKAPLQFIRMSKFNDILLKVLSEKMKLEQTITYKGWQIYIFTKK